MAQASQSQQAQRKHAAEAAGELTESHGDLLAHLMQYAKENPSTAALWCFGLGFILGWKLKPW